MNVKQKLNNILARFRGLFPERMPQGYTEFNNLCNSIISIYKPAMDEISVRFVVATLLQRLGPTEAYKSKRFFAISLARGAAGQVGAYAMEEIKNQQRAAQEAAKLAEAPAPVEADGQSLQNH